ncbi:ABC transporter substrate-binding protein [Bosea sp. F3-2]|uniref:ABC transporter substrate-binding protein n=1 Tax=Bosea sp. F3-2 TaxID=2599640 RepID=UPI0011EE217C|nr:ABC transporter substrate-binding protein [Bosea sp. F3-2]QEL22978.1 ABC transporter substrate-binding protein [Bosea sp. F3-2]
MIDRRTLLALAAGSVAGIGPGYAQSTALRIGYVPVIGASALFVLAGDGSARDAGLDLKLNKFDSGPNAIQAFASGTIDILVVGVAPVAVARSRGLDTSVIAAAAVGGTAFVAGPTLAKAFAENANDPARAFAAFRATTGRKAKLGTLPPGGVPTVALHHWLWKIGKVARSDVEISNMGIEVVQQAMLTGAIDGGTLLEPSATLVPERDPRIKRIVNSPDMFPNIPGVVVAASGALVKSRPEVAERFVGLFHRATVRIRKEPAKVAPLVLAVLGGDLVAEATITRALASPAVSFVNDPAQIRKATEELLAYQMELGDFPQAPALDGLFNQALYERGVQTLVTR